MLDFTYPRYKVERDPNPVHSMRRVRASVR